MEFVLHSHRHGLVIADEPKFKATFDELLHVIKDISDNDLKKEFAKKQTMSLSVAINSLLDERLVAKGWDRQAAIFADPTYDRPRETHWRLDFAKGGAVSVEVAFNHGEAIAWNLLKPVLASELNHVKKFMQTEIGVVIAATDELKETGAFDSAVGSYEKIVAYLKPLHNVLTTPMVIIGLKAPMTFKVKKVKDGNKHTGTIIEL